MLRTQQNTYLNVYPITHQKKKSVLVNDKPFYRNLATVHTFGFVLLFFDAGGFADLINGALLVAHELSVLFNLET